MTDIEQRKRYSNMVDECVEKMAKIILALGVEEILITPDTHQHVINTATAIDENAMERFCSQVDLMYASLGMPLYGGDDAG